MSTRFRRFLGCCVGLLCVVAAWARGAEVPISVFPREVSVLEGAAEYTYISIVPYGPAPADRVTIRVTTNSEWGTSANFQTGTATHSFSSSNWTTPFRFGVKALEDAGDDHGFKFWKIYVDDAGENSGIIMVREVDNDCLGQGLTITGGGAVPEGGSIALSVAPKLAPAHGETLTVSIGRKTGDRSLTASPGSLTFTASDYGAKTITVRAAQDNDVDNGEATFDIVLTSSRWNLAESVDYRRTFFEADDDDLKPSFSVSSLSYHFHRNGGYSFALPAATGGNAVPPTCRRTAELYRCPPLTYSLSSPPAGLSFSPLTRLLSGTPAALSDRTAYVYSATDADGDVATVTIHMQVSGVGHNPSFSVAATDIRLDQYRLMSPVTLPTAAGGHGALAYSLSCGGGLPVGLGFDAAARTLSGLPADAHESPPKTCVYRATDTIGHAASQTFRLHVRADVDGRNFVFSPAGGVSVAEGGTATYTVRPGTNPGGTITVTVTPSVGSDLTVDTDPLTAGNQNTLTFDASTWSTAKTVTVSAAEDLDGDADTDTLSHKGSGGYSGVVKHLGATVSDNDPKAILAHPKMLVEEGRSRSFGGIGGLRLATQPSADVTVTITATGDPDVKVDTDPNTAGDQNALVITPLNYSKSKEFWVTATDDEDGDSDAATLTYTASGGGYDEVAAATTQLILGDDDKKIVLLGPPSSVEWPDATSQNRPWLVVPEGGSATYKVALSMKPSANVSVSAIMDISTDSDLSSVPQTTQANPDEQLTFTPANYSTGQTVTVSARADGDAVDGTGTMIHQAIGGGFTLSDPVLWLHLVEEDTDQARVVVETLGNSSAQPDRHTMVRWQSRTDRTKHRHHVFVREGKSAPGFTVKLSKQPSANVTVTISSASVSGSGSVSFDTDPDTAGDQSALTFTATDWSTAKTVSVTAGTDANAVNRVDCLQASATGGGYAVTDLKLPCIVEADGANRLVFTPSDRSLTIGEGSSGSYTVALAQRPLSSTTALGHVAQPTPSVSAVDTGNSEDGNKLTFDSSTWSRTVVISPDEDVDGDDDEFVLSHSLHVPFFSGGEFFSPLYANPFMVNTDVTVSVTDNDAKGLKLSSTAIEVAEGKSTTLTAALATKPSADVTVTVTGAGGAVAFDTDADTSGSQSKLIFTAANWSTPQTVTFTGNQDADSDDESEILTFAALGGGYANLRGGVVVFVEDDDTPAFVFSKSKVTVAENGTATYKVSLATKPNASVTASISATDDSDADIALDTDPVAAGHQNTLVFTEDNYSTPQTVTVFAALDRDTANGEASLGHSAWGGGYGDATGSVTAVESDNGVTLTAGNIGRTGATLTIGGWSRAWWHKGGDGSSTCAKVATGGSSASLTALTPLANHTYTAYSRRNCVAADALAIVKFVTASKVTLTAGAVTSTGATLTIGGWSRAWWHKGGGSTATCVKVPADQSTASLVGLRRGVSHTYKAYSDDGCKFELASATFATPALVLSRSSVAVEEGSTATYTVRLSKAPSAAATVTVSRKAGAGQDGDLSATPAQMTFTTTDWSRPRTVTISAADDVDGEDGTAIFEHAVAGGGYAGVAAELTATEIDSGGEALLVLEPTRVSVLEGATGAYTVRLSRVPSASVTVAVTRKAGAGQDGNLSAAPAQLTFTTTDWSRSQTVTISAATDLDTENGAATFEHRASGGDYEGVAASLTATEIDDDRTQIALSRTTLAVAEGSTATYTVRLSKAPSASITVSVSRKTGPEQDGDLSAAPPTLTFTTTDWSSPQTVTISAAEDLDSENGTAKFEHRASGGDYEGVAAELTATEIDDETDYDTDGDGLIEIRTLEQLNAVRWDLDGDGSPSSGNETSHAAAFPDVSSPSQGCPATRCAGYELAANLDFASALSYAAGTVSAAWTAAPGWSPLGTASDKFRATFDGNWRVVANLFIDRSDDDQGLFGVVGPGGKVLRLGVADAGVSGGANVGALAGINEGSVVYAWSSSGASERIEASGGNVGGLVGRNRGIVAASRSTATVELDSSDRPIHIRGSNAGGLVGATSGATAKVAASWAGGSVDNDADVAGGLLGLHGGGSVAASYSTGAVTLANGAAKGGLVGKVGSARRLRRATGILGRRASRTMWTRARRRARRRSGSGRRPATLASTRTGISMWTV